MSKHVPYQSLFPVTKKDVPISVFESVYGTEAKVLEPLLGSVSPSIALPSTVGLEKRRLIFLGEGKVPLSYLTHAALCAKSHNVDVVYIGEKRDLPPFPIQQFDSVEEYLEKEANSTAFETYLFRFKGKGKSERFEEDVAALVGAEPRIIHFDIKDIGDSVCSDGDLRLWGEEEIKPKPNSPLRERFRRLSVNSSDEEEDDDSPFSKKNTSSGLGGYILDNMAMDLISHCFQNGLELEPFYIDCEGGDEFSESLVTVLASFVGSVFHPGTLLFKDKMKAKGKLRKGLSKAAQFPSFFPNYQESIPLSSFKGVYFGVFKDTSSLLSMLPELKKANLDLKEAIFVVHSITPLCYCQDAIASYLGYEVYVISPESAFPSSNFRRENEMAIRSYRLCRDLISKKTESFGVYPFSEEVVTGIKPFAYWLYAFDWRNYSPSFSYLAFCEEVTKRESDLPNLLFGKANPDLLWKIHNGESADFLSLYYSLASTYDQKESLLRAFGEYEHNMWARRTLLFLDEEGIDEKKDMLVPFEAFSSNPKLSLAFGKEAKPNEVEQALEKDVAIFDFATILQFLSTICRDFVDFDLNKPCKRIAMEDIEFIKRKTKETGYVDLSVALSGLYIDETFLGNLIGELAQEAEIGTRPILELDVTKENASILTPPLLPKTMVTLLPLSSLGCVPSSGTLLHIGDNAFLVSSSALVPNIAYAKLAVSISRGYNVSSFSPYVSFERSAGEGEPPFVLLYLKKLPNSREAHSPKGVGELYESLGSLAFLPGSKEAGLYKVAFAKRFGLAKGALEAIKTKIGEGTLLLHAPFVEAIDPQGILSYHVMMGHNLDQYIQSGLDVTELLRDLLRGYEPSEESFPYAHKYPSLCGTLGKNREKMNVFLLKEPIPDFTFAPILSLLYGIGEEEAVSLLKGDLGFDEDALQHGVIALAKDGVPIREGFDRAKEVLLNEEGNYLPKALRSFEDYPFGKNVERLLYLRIMKLGLLGIDALFHSVLPVSQALRRKINLGNSFLGAYGETLLNLSIALDDLEFKAAEENEAKERIVRYANDAFFLIYFARYSAIFDSDEERSAALNLLPYFLGQLRFGSKQDIMARCLFEADKDEALFSKNAYGRSNGFRVLASYIASLSKAESDRLFERARGKWGYFQGKVTDNDSDRAVNVLFDSPLILAGTLENEPSWNASNELREKDSFTFLSPKEEVRISLLDAFGETDFVVKYKLHHGRTTYYALFPKQDEDWIKTDECLFAYKKRNGSKPYYVTTNADIIDALSRMMRKNLKGGESHGFDPDDDF